MIGLFAGTATAPSASSTSTGQGSAEGFGATLLEEITAAVAGATADTTAPTGTIAAPALPVEALPTADELLAALATGFTGTIDASATEPAAVVAEGEVDDTADATADPSLIAPATDQVAATPPPATAAAVTPPTIAPPLPVATEDTAQPAAPAPDSTSGVAPVAALSTSPEAAAVVATATPRASATSSATSAVTTAALPSTDAAATSHPVEAQAALPAAAAAVPRPLAAATVTTPAELELAVAPAPTEASPVADAVVAPKEGVAPVTLAPAVQQTAVSSTAAPVSVAAPVAVHVPLATQVATPIFTLAAAGPGEHVMTIDITPENLGPITVRAHVGADGVRVELFAPSDGARDALRAILPDIRKDMGGAGLGSNLDLSSQNQPADRGSEGDQQRRQPRGEAAATIDPTVSATTPWKLTDPSTTIDVMA